MKKIEVPTNPYNDIVRLYSRKTVEFHPGLTTLIGCNGSGKSTLMMLIKEQLKDVPGVLVLSYDDRLNGGHNLMEKFGFQERFMDLAQMMSSSEGERIHKGLEDFVFGMRKEIWRRSPQEIWIFMDAVGSGLSIDGIQEIKDLAYAIIEDNRGVVVYFVVSTNEYEFSIGADNIDVTTFKHVQFKNYEEYRKFILKTSEKKQRRYKG